jgi:hypothetical protein
LAALAERSIERHDACATHGDIVKAGTEVWLSWDSEFSFGIPLEAQDFHDSDTSTTTLAAQAK